MKRNRDKWVSLSLSPQDLEDLRELSKLLFGPEYGSISKALRFLIRRAIAEIAAISELKAELGLSEVSHE